jgi:hypothetical protein
LRRYILAGTGVEGAHAPEVLAYTAIIAGGAADYDRRVTVNSPQSDMVHLSFAV